MESFLKGFLRCLVKWSKDLLRKFEEVERQIFKKSFKGRLRFARILRRQEEKNCGKVE